MNNGHFIQTQIDTNDPAFLYLNLRPDENVRYVIRHHWAGFLGSLVIVLAMAIVPLAALLVLFIANPQLLNSLSIIAIYATSYYLFLLTFLFTSWINYYYNVIIITNHRLINVAQEGLLSRKTAELDFPEIENVSADVDGFLQAAFNFGLLVVETAGGGTSGARIKPGYFTVKDVPDPNRVARAILDLKEEIVGGEDRGE